MKVFKVCLIGLLCYLICLEELSASKTDEINYQYKELVKNHQYEQAAKLCQDTIKILLPDKSTEEKKSLEIWLDEAQRQQEIFGKMVKDLNSGTKKKVIDIDANTQVLIDRCDETGFTGKTQGADKKSYKGKWADISNYTIYDFFDLSKLKGEDKYNLALWCFNHNLSLQAENILISFSKDSSGKQNLINEFLARKRNIPMPEGGFVNVNNHWLSKPEATRIETLLNKLGEYKDALDNPSAVKESLSWEKALEKETEHFVVKSSLSTDALNDICILMEQACFIRQNLLGLTEQKEKLKVWVTRNKNEYQKITTLIRPSTPSWAKGGFIPGTDPANVSHTDYILVYYDLSDKTLLLSNVLLHEGTHFATTLIARNSQLAISNPPNWLDEGLATYFEGGKFTAKKLTIGLINKHRLPTIQENIRKKTYIKLADFINLTYSEFYHKEAFAYAQAWSIVYFLLNNRMGKYKRGFQKYLEAWKTKQFIMEGDGKDVWFQDRDKHLKIFEQCIGTPIDRLENEWKEYILSLQ